MPYRTGLPAALVRVGLTPEVVPGWDRRGSAAFYPLGAVSHWTAGPNKGERPSLAVCVNGRPGLSGPLCNTFLGRESVVVVAAGRANHAGAGGYRGLVGNSSVWGTEAENSGDNNWTEFQRWAYPRILAAYVLLGARRDLLCGHSEWTPRKIDIIGYTMDRLRAEAYAVLDGKAPGPIVKPAPLFRAEPTTGPLTPGVQGPRTARVQRVLRVLVDGLYGDGTVAAVQTLQSAYGLPRTGTCDLPTLEALDVQEDDMIKPDLRLVTDRAQYVAPHDLSRVTQLSEASVGEFDDETEYPVKRVDEALIAKIVASQQGNPLAP